MKAAISKIETFGLVDGPGIRTIIFFEGCNLRCKFCHNPETWQKKENNYTIEEIYNKILRSKPYFQNNGGVTFSGGEPLLHQDFIIELAKKLKEEKIHITLDTAGIGNGNYQELLKYIDLILLDIKSPTKEGFKEITQTNNFDKFQDFIKEINNQNKEVWIRQVIIPDINDNEEYIKKLREYIRKNIKNVTKLELLPFHTMGFEKYKKLNIKNPYENISAMDNKKCKELEEYYYKIKEEI